MVTYRWAFAILILKMYTLLEMLKNRISDKNRPKAETFIMMLKSYIKYYMKVWNLQ